ncbi:DUF819 family protein [Bacillus atrophaeus]|uniref:DUF819 family protein n=1 Tax=Bacillus atrophaeus TaxID=1452 RepID=UPI001BA987A6|nr:DUF819 family protein [Bacillus atrophaeus]QUF66642.1 DUF819 domain-containing protein [Bacillus atrophaeus]
MDSFISTDDVWVLWGFIAVWAAVSIYFEQRFKWASAISGAILALVGAMLFTNIGVLPVESPVYDSVWAYVVPLAIPLLLFQINVRQIFSESRRLLFIFLVSVGGTVLGSIAAFFLLKNHIPFLDKIGGMISASYIGGGINFAAMAAKFETPGEYVSATVVADNFMMALLFFILISIPTLKWFQIHYDMPFEDKVKAEGNGENSAESYWKRKSISLKDIAFNMGAAFALVAVSVKIAGFFKSVFSHPLLTGTFGDQYLVLTTLTVLVIFLFPRFFEKLNGSQELGTYFIYLFFVVIGIPADLRLIVTNAPLILLFVFLIAISNLIVSLLVGKLFRVHLEEILLAVNATVGGPTTAAAMAIAKGWRELVAPIMLVGTLGYLIGNYVGTFMGNWFSSFL